MPKNKWGGVHYIVKDGYLYGVKKPDYFQFTGNLTVVNRETDETLIIWPLMSGGYEYGYRLQEDGEAFEIYVDEDMKPIDKGDTVSVQKVEEHKDELKKIFSKADKMFSLK